jgi:hypothetical protein
MVFTMFQIAFIHLSYRLLCVCLKWIKHLKRYGKKATICNSMHVTLLKTRDWSMACIRRYRPISSYTTQTHVIIVKYKIINNIFYGKMVIFIFFLWLSLSLSLMVIFSLGKQGQGIFLMKNQPSPGPCFLGKGLRSEKYRYHHKRKSPGYNTRFILNP